jgi:hypothetical protein
MMAMQPKPAVTEQPKAQEVKVGHDVMIFEGTRGAMVQGVTGSEGRLTKEKCLANEPSNEIGMLYSDDDWEAVVVYLKKDRVGRSKPLAGAGDTPKLQRIQSSAGMRTFMVEKDEGDEKDEKDKQWQKNPPHLPKGDSTADSNLSLTRNETIKALVYLNKAVKKAKWQAAKNAQATSETTQAAQEVGAVLKGSPGSTNMPRRSPTAKTRRPRPGQFGKTKTPLTGYPASLFDHACSLGYFCGRDQVDVEESEIRFETDSDEAESDSPIVAFEAHLGFPEGSVLTHPSMLTPSSKKRTSTGKVKKETMRQVVLNLLKNRVKDTEKDDAATSIRPAATTEAGHSTMEAEINQIPSPPILLPATRLDVRDTGLLIPSATSNVKATLFGKRDTKVSEAEQKRHAIIKPGKAVPCSLNSDQVVKQASMDPLIFPLRDESKRLVSPYNSQVALSLKESEANEVPFPSTSETEHPNSTKISSKYAQRLARGLRPANLQMTGPKQAVEKMQRIIRRRRAKAPNTERMRSPSTRDAEEYQLEGKVSESDQVAAEIVDSIDDEIMMTQSHFRTAAPPKRNNSEMWSQTPEAKRESRARFIQWPGSDLFHANHQTETAPRPAANETFSFESNSLIMVADDASVQVSLPQSPVAILTRRSSAQLSSRQSLQIFGRPRSKEIGKMRTIDTEETSWDGMEFTREAERSLFAWHDSPSWRKVTHSQKHDPMIQSPLSFDEKKVEARISGEHFSRLSDYPPTNTTLATKEFIPENDGSVSEIMGCFPKLKESFHESLDPSPVITQRMEAKLPPGESICGAMVPAGPPNTGEGRKGRRKGIGNLFGRKLSNRNSSPTVLEADSVGKILVEIGNDASNQIQAEKFELKASRRLPKSSPRHSREGGVGSLKRTLRLSMSAPRPPSVTSVRTTGIINARVAKCVAPSTQVDAAPESELYDISNIGSDAAVEASLMFDESENQRPRFSCCEPSVVGKEHDHHQSGEPDHFRVGPHSVMSTYSSRHHSPSHTSPTPLSQTSSYLSNSVILTESKTGVSFQTDDSEDDDDRFEACGFFSSGYADARDDDEEIMSIVSGSHGDTLLEVVRSRIAADEAQEQARRAGEYAAEIARRAAAKSRKAKDKSADYISRHNGSNNFSPVASPSAYFNRYFSFEDDAPARPTTVKIDEQAFSPKTDHDPPSVGPTPVPPSILERLGHPLMLRRLMSSAATISATAAVTTPAVKSILKPSSHGLPPITTPPPPRRFRRRHRSERSQGFWPSMAFERFFQVDQEERRDDDDDDDDEEDSLPPLYSHDTFADGDAGREMIIMER